MEEHDKKVKEACEILNEACKKLDLKLSVSEGSEGEGKEENLMIVHGRAPGRIVDSISFFGLCEK